MSTSRLVSLLYAINFLVCLAVERWGFALGWLLLAVGYAIMDGIPAALWRATRDQRWDSPRWIGGHFCLNLAVILLLADLLQDRLFP
jgi:hypothetical protein